MSRFLRGGQSDDVKGYSERYLMDSGAIMGLSAGTSGVETSGVLTSKVLDCWVVEKNGAGVSGALGYTAGSLRPSYTT